MFFSSNCKRNTSNYAGKQVQIPLRRLSWNRCWSFYFLFSSLVVCSVLHCRAMLKCVSLTDWLSEYMKLENINQATPEVLKIFYFANSYGESDYKSGCVCIRSSSNGDCHWKKSARRDHAR